MRTVLEFTHCEYRSVIVGASGQQSTLPIIFTDQGVLSQFVLYIHLHRRKSRSWQDAATFAMRLLLEFAAANHDHFKDPKVLFQAFADALFIGTIGNSCDPSDLWWYPRTRNDAGSIISHVTHFTDWLAIVNEEKKLQLNPWRDATQHEQRLNWAAYEHRRHNAFLSHLWGTNKGAKKSRSVRGGPLFIDRSRPPKTFPDSMFEALTSQGFRATGYHRQHGASLRNTLIAYLMHFGGLRLSEALSLWTGDVEIEGGEVIVRVYHPEYGVTPNGTMRSIYLDSKFGLQARNTLVKTTDALFLGWKNGLITDTERNCFEVFFFPYETSYEFAKMWRDYHLIQRTKPALDENHPYAFTNQKGQPYSHRMFRKAHRLAVERLGLMYNKVHGTTPHGHRHAYGQRLAAAGATPIQIKTALHHASISSSETYTQPSSQDIRNGLQEIESKLRVQHHEDASQ